jgi:hypothetical protein
MRAPSFTLLAASFVAFFPASARAQAAPEATDPKAECVAAYEATQSLRRDGKLTLARTKALQCAQDACPSVTKRDCVQWLAEIDMTSPSIVVHAHDARGLDIAAVRTTIDGAVVSTRADGGELTVDPGERSFHFETEGFPPVDQRVVVHVGEKRRALDVTFGSLPPPPPPPPPPQVAPSRFTPPVIGLTALGIVGLGAFATLGVVAITEKSDLTNTCAPRCPDDSVAAVRWKLTAADVSLGVGVAAIVVAGVLLATNGPKSGQTQNSHKSAASSLRLDAAPSPTGAFVSLAGRL